MMSKRSLIDGTLKAGLALAVPAVWLAPDVTRIWVTVGGTALLAGISFVSARATGRPVVAFFAPVMIMAVVTGGVAYFMAQWL